jgi:predicted Rossmann fold flavoprotein
MQIFDVIIIGAGASGLMCGIEAGKRGRSVLIIEHSDKPGKKILISGGGRCNFTNLHISPENYISDNPHFCKSALSRYTQNDFISLVEKYKIEYYEKKLGQLFCTGSAREILNMLLSEIKKAGASIKTECTILSISRTEDYIIKTTSEDFRSQSLVIATGGLSIPKIGATSFGYEAARQFGISIITCRPSLAGIVFNNKDMKDFNDLAGVSIDAEVKCGGKSFRENILFTHKGLSGPAIIQISNYLKEKEAIYIDLLPGINFSSLVTEWKNESPKAELKNLISRHLPKKLALRLSDLYSLERPVIQFSDKELKVLQNRFQNWEVFSAGTEGYDKAEVTLGGINTNELSSKTFEAKKEKGLYFIGEVIDVTGWLGGYNFQWAWSSGFCAGQYV